MLLPNAERAFVDTRKLADYCLSAAHPLGRHKAAVFRRVLGLGPPDALTLRDWLLAAARTTPAQVGAADAFGQRFQLDFPVPTRARQRALVRPAWIVRAGEDFPRLTTCYVLPE